MIYSLICYTVLQSFAQVKFLKIKNNYSMKIGILWGGMAGMILAAVLVAGVAVRPTDAGTVYSFVARGDVKQIDKAANNFKVYARHTTSSGEHDIAGKIVEYNFEGAKFYKYDSKLKKMRTTLGSIAVGDEVVLKGTKKDGDKFVVTEVTKNEHTVKLKGKLQAHNASNKTLTIELEKIVRPGTGGFYKSAMFTAGTDIKVYYGSGTKVYNVNGGEINVDEIANNREKITVENAVVRYGSRVEANADSKVIDGKHSF
jgi:hypothetical protein